MVTIKRYALFHGDNYYAGGGWYDFVGVFDSVDEAKAGLDPDNTESPSGGWAHIVDLLTMEMVEQARCENSGNPNYDNHVAHWSLASDD